MNDSVEHGDHGLLVDARTRVTCPKCEHEFSLEEGFAKKSLEAIEAASEGAFARLQAEARAVEEKRAAAKAAQAEALLQEQLKDQRAIFEAQKAQHAEALERMRKLDREAAELREADLKKRLGDQAEQLAAAEKARVELAAREKALAAQEAGLGERIEREAAARAVALADKARTDFEGRLKAQAEQIAAFQATELRLRKDRAELEAKQAQLELDVQRKLDEERKQIADSVRHAESEKSRLREADLQKKLDDMRAQVEEMKRKAEQGSQQAQGEVLELLLEEQIAKAFPLDVIEEVKKGARGGDIVHRVMTRSEQQAGLILWEAKRAQNWSVAWPGKLKDDMREIGADLGVIVATSLPKEFEGDQQFGPHEDVWVTTPGMALPVAGLLRALVENVYRQRLIAANREEKADAVYDYLTGPAFAQKWKKIYDVFQSMKRELDTERTVTTQRWTRREKQMQQAVLTLARVAGDIQGLAQQDLPQLELERAALDAPEHDEKSEE
jgi:hypothetical protein